MRTVIHRVDYAQHCLKHEIPMSAVFEAVGYLSAWSVEGFGHVEIITDRDGDLTAYYSQTEGDREYVIGAVYREESRLFSYHS
jgi:hypothetical protein